MSGLVHRIRRQAIDTPSRPALFGTVQDSWRQLRWTMWWASIRQAAAGLDQLDVVSGDRVVLWTDSRPEWAVLWQAACAVGALPVLIPSDVPDATVVRMLDGIDAPVALSDGSRTSRLKALRSSGAVKIRRLLSPSRLDGTGHKGIDFDDLIERGATHTDVIELRLDDLDDDGVAAVLEDGAQVSHRFLLEAAARVPQRVQRVYLSSEPCTLDGLIATTVALRDGAELWMAPDAERLLRDLHGLEPGAVLLDAAGWSAMLDALGNSAAEAPGLRGGLVRLTMGAAGEQGAMGALARAFMAPVHDAVGLLDAVCWVDGELPTELGAELASLGVFPLRPSGA